ncbi:hypothetical protein OJ997_27420 [Solirubrobacter phytolaccae]|uniref:Uncharacterized protein n=1 Tax=Solirubrobacter phytolaccae TaxID=1404360 RepID=A0A9X3SA33_9ACTN|nr:hypothetical protein [Solirubrobacter phytolaccae]MDA0184069.1 hypothetical protein [Solirubrobacter phytolaccae]
MRRPDTTVLPELEQQLRGAALRTQPRRRRLVWPLTAVAVLLSGASLATAGVKLFGDPVARTAPAGNTRSGPGTTVPGSVRLLSLRTADPNGGAPWGMRVWNTSRGAACWQVGRVVGQQVGVLDRAGRFHALPIEQSQCRPLDARGTLFAVQDQWMLANGGAEPWTCTPSERPVPGRPRCLPGNVRLVRYGFLGPDASAIEVGGRRHAVTEDAFLLVDRADFSSPEVPAPIAVVYRDGSHGPARDYRLEDPQRGTTPPGYEPLADNLPSDVSAPLRFTAKRRGKDLIFTLSFRAPVATRRFGVSYRIVIDGPRGGRRCDERMRFTGFDTPGDVRRGQRIEVKLTPGIQIRYGHGWCPGRYRGKVILHDSAHVVGRFSWTQR